GPAKRQQPSLEFLDHWPVTRAFNTKPYRLLPLNSDDLFVLFDRLPRSIDQIAIRVLGMNCFDIEILNVCAKISCTPSNVFVVPQHNSWSPRYRHPSDIEITRHLQVCHVPDARNAMWEMRVVREDGLASLSTIPRDCPVVTSNCLMVAWHVRG